MKYDDYIYVFSYHSECQTALREINKSRPEGIRADWAKSEIHKEVPKNLRQLNNSRDSNEMESPRPRPQAPCVPEYLPVSKFAVNNT